MWKYIGRRGTAAEEVSVGATAGTDGACPSRPKRRPTARDRALSRESIAEANPTTATRDATAATPSTTRSNSCVTSRRWPTFDTSCSKGAAAASGATLMMFSATPLRPPCRHLVHARFRAPNRGAHARAAPLNPVHARATPTRGGLDERRPHDHRGASSRVKREGGTPAVGGGC